MAKGYNLFNLIHNYDKDTPFGLYYEEAVQKILDTDIDNKSKIDDFSKLFEKYHILHKDDIPHFPVLGGKRKNQTKM